MPSLPFPLPHICPGSLNAQYVAASASLQLNDERHGSRQGDVSSEIGFRGLLALPCF